ncbi:MAG: twin-arginine translocase subunit TatB [Alphaproteobacteria bacterium]|nr:twin-arginine translocase subunit TatB [Alphaproteobacteria bacterium]
MFDVGLPEILVIIIVALVVVGPKDLPRVVRGFARTIARMRRMVDEFMGTVNEYVRESELQELKEAVEETRRAMRGQIDFDHLNAEEMRRETPKGPEQGQQEPLLPGAVDEASAGASGAVEPVVADSAPRPVSVPGAPPTVPEVGGDGASTPEPPPHDGPADGKTTT